MGHENFHDNFQARVNYAAQCALKRIKSRRRDSCYENHDGDLVVTVLVRRARNNPKLWRAIAKEFGGKFPQSWLDKAEKYEGIGIKKLPGLAEEMRRKAHADQEEKIKT